MRIYPSVTLKKCFSHIIPLCHAERGEESVKHKRCIRMFHPLLFLLLATACSEDTPLLPDTGKDSDVLQLLSVQVDEGETARALVTTANLDNLRLYATTTAGAAYTGNDGKPYGDYIKTADGWNPTGTAQIKINSNATVYAVHPGGSPISQNGTDAPQASVNILTEDGFTPTLQTDYLYSSTPQTVRSANHQVSFSNMKHALAKVSFKVTKMGNEAMTLTKIEIREKNNSLLAGNGTMNITNGTLSGGLGGVSTLTLTGSAVLEESLTNPNITCLIAPASNMSALTFRLTITAGTETRTLETKVLGNSQTWEKGTHYVYTISVGKGQIEFKNMRIYDWLDDATTSVGIQ